MSVERERERERERESFSAVSELALHVCYFVKVVNALIILNLISLMPFILYVLMSVSFELVQII